MKKLSLFAFALALVVALAGTAQKAHAQNRFEVGGQLAIHRLPELGETPIGYGFRFTYNAYLPFLAFDSEIDNYPTSSTGNFGATEGFFGLRAGVRVGPWGVFVKARPGFAHFGGGFDEQRLTSRTHFALDLGGVAEYFILPHVGVRWDLSDVMVHYGNATLLAGPGGPIGPPLGTRSNLQTTIGVVVSF
jgi:Outer membrane protein beta-barrel domain